MIPKPNLKNGQRPPSSFWLPSWPAASFAKAVETYRPASATVQNSDGNWGLSFPEEGKPPVANATFEELKQYDAYYAKDTEEKVIYLTFDCGFENGNTPAILDALKNIRYLPPFS